MASGHERPWFLVGVRKYLASFSIYLVVAQWSRQNRHLLRRKKIHEMKSVKIKYGHRSGSLTKKINCVGLNPTDRISPCSTKCGDTRSRECDKWEWRGLANEWSEMHPLAHSLCVHTTSAVAVVIFFFKDFEGGRDFQWEKGSGGGDLTSRESESSCGATSGARFSLPRFSRHMADAARNCTARPTTKRRKTWFMMINWVFCRPIEEAFTRLG